MRSERRDGSDERRVLIGMITNKRILGSIASKWEEGLFNSKWSETIAIWCVEFYRKHQDAPGKLISDRFQAWAEKTKDEDTIGIIESFLNSLSDEYTESNLNTEYILDLASRYFSKNKAIHLADEVKLLIERGQQDQAEKKIATFSRPQIGIGSGINVLEDKEAILQAFSHKSEVLVEYPGALKDFFGDTLERDGFVAFWGAEKSGKSWFLMDMAWRAMIQQRRVAFFEVGDMSQHQVLRRMMCRATKLPKKPKEIKYPTYIEHRVEEPVADVTFENRKYDKCVNEDLAWKACKRIMKNHSGDLLKLSCHPNTTINVLGIRSILQDWERDNWVPDIIIIDYADILSPPVGVTESRDQINLTWKQLRSMSQALHCLVVTASQADAQSYGKELIDRTNFSEDKRKLSHTTAIFGINCTMEEQQIGLRRLNRIVVRDDEFDITQCCHVVGCLDLGNPAVKSTF